MEATPEKKTSLIPSVFEWAQVLSIALVIIACVYTFLGRMIDVKGHSMENTLTHGERLILSSASYTPQRGDIVVITRGEEQDPLIKRVIGLPGDTIRIDGVSGEVYLNGEVLSESYITGKTATELMTGPVTVGEGELFVMGDNRAPGCSLDSRSIGCVLQSNVVGKVVYRLMPLQQMGGLYDD